MWRWIVVGFLIGVISAEGMSGSERLDRALRESDSEWIVPYKPLRGGKFLRMHLDLPEVGEGQLRPALLFFHGGGWEGGNVGQMRAHAAYFQSLGFVSARAELRSATGKRTVQNVLQDALDAANWLFENAAEYGIDRNRIILVGESSGGHLAAWVTLRKRSPRERPAATILFNAMLDLEEIPWAKGKNGLKGLSSEKLIKLSPVDLVSESNSSVPIFLLHGSEDGVVAASQSMEFAKKYRESGGFAKLRIWEGKGHAFFMYLPELGMKDRDSVLLSLEEIEGFLHSRGLMPDPLKMEIEPLHLFAGFDGSRSFSELTNVGEYLVGSTYKGGRHDAGTVFRYHPETGEYRILHHFSKEAGGYEVFSGFAIDGETIYGVCKFGGEGNKGTLWRIRVDGSGFQVLHEFAGGEQGFFPHSGPILHEGSLMGTTYHGGSTTWGGCVYRYHLEDADYEVICSFGAETGRHPTGQLVEIDGWLYGTLSDLFQHENEFYGSLFRLHPSTRELEILHRFNLETDGAHPYDRLTFDGKDTLYGSSFGIGFDGASKGTLFSYQISNRQFSVLHDFEKRPGTGSKPNGSLLFSADREWLYGVAHGSTSPDGDDGTLFQIRPDGGDFRVLHRFDGGLKGIIPMRSLVLRGDYLYGVSVFGGLFSDPKNKETGHGLLFRIKISSY